MNVSRDGGGTPYLNVSCDGVDMAGTDKSILVSE
jgi:hypothetical protein